MIGPMKSPLLTLLKRTARMLAKRLGYEVARIRAPVLVRNRLIDQIISREVNVLFDIGANSGQFATELRRQGYAGIIVSVEPLLHAYQQLEMNSRLDEKWIAVHGAIGASRGETRINVSQNSWSSSIRSLEQRIVHIEPSVAYVSSESVQVESLDNLYEQYASDKDRAFLKLDVQGYENEVLKGAGHSLPKFIGVLSEASLSRHYQGEWLIDELIAHLHQREFALHDISEVFRDRASGQLIQVDALFWKIGEPQA
jgi:FkbM family methyltransferase